jgi:hypothetical protein
MSARVAGCRTKPPLEKTKRKKVKKFKKDEDGNRETPRFVVSLCSFTSGSSSPP